MKMAGMDLLTWEAFEMSTINARARTNILNEAFLKRINI